MPQEAVPQLDDLYESGFVPLLMHIKQFGFGALATSIERFGIYSVGRLGRLVWHSPESEEIPAILDALAMGRQHYISGQFGGGTPDFRAISGDTADIFFHFGWHYQHPPQIKVRHGCLDCSTESSAVAAMPEERLHSKERNSLLIVIAALCKSDDLDLDRHAASNLLERVEEIGCKLSLDTLRGIARQAKVARETYSR